jgi:hypothetical protein
VSHMSASVSSGKFKNVVSVCSTSFVQRR